MNDARKLRILVVDDDPAIVELLVMVLEMAGYEVLTAGDGAQAVSLLQNLVPESLVDVIMVDLMMPVMDGLRFMRWLRAEQKSTVPVLVLTGRNKPGGEAMILQAGADAVLYKPAEPREIIKMLATLLDRTGADGSASPNDS